MFKNYTSYYLHASLVFMMIMVCISFIGKVNIPSCQADDDLGGRETQSSAVGDNKDEVSKVAKKRIRHFLGSTQEIEVRKDELKYELPFIKELPKKVLIVVHEELIPNSKESVKMRMIFSAEGYFLRAESISRINDPYRRRPESLEKSMRGAFEKITGVPQMREDAKFASLWRKICARYAMIKAREFNFYLVQYEFEDKTQKPVLILNLWIPGNPLHVPDDAPVILKDRIRTLFDLNGNLIRSDNIL